MYISYQGQQAIHQNIVNQALRHSELRRMQKEPENGTETRGRARKPSMSVTALFRLVIGVAARP